MAPEKALANLYGLWQRRWIESKAQGDKAQKKLLAWASRNELRIRDIWETLKAPEQILTLEKPLISRPRRAVRRRVAGPQ